ncbi:class I SAM-dependent methyltransferase [bacterium]|nr:class I SAM-dependent methyltransferase [bacterium]
MGGISFRGLCRIRRARRLMDTTQFVVLSNFLRTGLVEFLAAQPGHTASVDEVVEFYFATATPADPEDIRLLVDYAAATETPTKTGYVEQLLARASWLARCRGQVAFTPPAGDVHDWVPAIRALHARYDPQFPGTDAAKRAEARAHWDDFLTMAAAYGLAEYADGRVTLTARRLRQWQSELEIFGDGYYGLDDLLGVLLKVEALRAERGFIVRPPPFMLEACDAVARRVGIPSYWQHVPRLEQGGCRVLDLGCGSGIYSNAFAEKGNECVAVDHTPWVFYRAFLGARPGVQVWCRDMNQLPPAVLARRFTHVVSNLAAHHLRGRVDLFRRQRELLGSGGEVCVLNYDYSLPPERRASPVARIKRQFAAQVRYNWGVLEYDRGGVQLVSPAEVARELETAGFLASVHPCGLMNELYLVRGVRP